MSMKGLVRVKRKGKAKQSSPRFNTQNPHAPTRILPAEETIQRARLNPDSLTPTDVKRLQAAIGNEATGQLLSGGLEQNRRTLLHRSTSDRPSSVNPSLAQVGRSPSNMLQRTGPSVTVSGSRTGGFKIDINPEAKKKLGFLEIGAPYISLEAKHTEKSQLEKRKEQEFSGGIETEGKKEAGASTGITPKVKLAAKKKWGNVLFTDAEPEIGPGGGAIPVTVGGDWGSKSVGVKFTLLGYGEKSSDIKILSATSSVKLSGVLNIDGVNFACSGTLSFDIQPHYPGIAKWLLKKEVKKKLTSFAGKTGRMGALPGLFITGGLETLWAAGKNIIVGKEINEFRTAAQQLADEAANGFVSGVFGSYRGLGASAGRRWFLAAYDIVKVDHPEITEEEFRQALMESAHWQGNTKGMISKMVKVQLYDAYISRRSGELKPRDKRMIRVRLFDDPGPMSTIRQDLGVKAPELFKYREQGPDIELPEEEIRAKNVPPDVRGEAKHRVRGHQHEGSLIFAGDGLRYYWSYNKKLRELIVHGGDAYEKIPFSP